MLIAHLSDLHLAGPGRRAYGRVDTAANLKCCINSINNMAPVPELVVITGDITYSGNREEVEQAALLLDTLRVPWYVVPGNHDHRETLALLLDLQAGDMVFRKYGNCFDYLIEDRELCLIALDSSTPTTAGGEITLSQLDWLQQCLRDNRNRPTMLFMHHPPVKCSVLETDEDGFAGADALSEIISKTDSTIRILCGHIHLAAHVNWCGTVVSTAPSMGLQLLLDLTMKLPSAFLVEDPGYYLHYYTSAGVLVSHTVYLRETHDGPYLFDRNV